MSCYILFILCISNQQQFKSKQTKESVNKQTTTKQQPKEQTNKQKTKRGQVRERENKSKKSGGGKQQQVYTYIYIYHQRPVIYFGLFAIYIRLIVDFTL
jgi:hypothetical protein